MLKIRDLYKAILVNFLVVLYMLVCMPLTDYASGNVQVSTWKNAQSGALSISVDENYMSCLSELQSNGFNGTYFYIGVVPPSYMDLPTLYNAGMELGSHTINHICGYVAQDALRYEEIEPNIQSICYYSPEPCKDVISFAWPCGYTTISEQAITADYFLSSRGYNINMLEETTPANFQNLKSFNSHEHPPYPPADLKTVVDMAEQQGKWANLVFHSTCNDDGAISYARTKDVWVAPIGTVVKYILQRNRFILNTYQENPNSIVFSYSRSAVPSSPVRTFETAFGPEDQITLEVQINDTRSVSSVTLDGISQPYTVRTINGNKLVLINTPVGTTTRTITVSYASAIIPTIALNPTSLSFSADVGTNPATQAIAVSNSGGGTLSWTATADSTAQIGRASCRERVCGVV